MSRKGERGGYRWRGAKNAALAPLPKARPDPLGSGPQPRAWCYVCGTAHAWAESCPPVRPLIQGRTR